MKISIITVFPEIHETFFKTSIIGKAVEKGLIDVKMYRFSDFCSPKERIDQPTAGPGAGMIIKPEVIEKAITTCQDERGPGVKIFFSPQGTKLTQPLFRSMAQSLFTPTGNEKESTSKDQPKALHIILVCPRYEGIDARVEAFYADHIISIGDYVLMGGDLPATVFLEGLLRLYPGIVGSWTSVENESFSGPFLDHPEYGLPTQWHGMNIPQIIQSGNHGAIEQWRKQEACKKTLLKRFDWFASAGPTEQERAMAMATIPPHYVALMHTQVKLKDGLVGTTSITSIDLHDTARSCATYGIKNFFMVNPLQDQQAIIKLFLDFWQSDIGKKYNPSRYHAVEKVRPMLQLSDVIETITKQDSQPPILIATSAKTRDHNKIIDFYSQGLVWEHQKPVLFIFGTGQGLADELIDACDYLLLPVEGLTNYNHLSVRSAMAIVLDRWLGLNPQKSPNLPK